MRSANLGVYVLPLVFPGMDDAELSKVCLTPLLRFNSPAAL